MLVDYWRDRWLARRITRPDVLESVPAARSSRASGSRSETERLTTGSGAGGGGGSPGRAGRVSAGVETGTDIAVVAPCEQGDHTFVERLYRSSNSYADRLTRR